MKKCVSLMLVFCMLFLCSCTLFVTKNTLENEKDEIFEDFKKVSNDIKQSDTMYFPGSEKYFGIELLLEMVEDKKITLTYKQNKIPEGTEIICGDDFFVKRKDAHGNWELLEMNEGIGWDSIGYTLSEGSTKSWTIDLDVWYENFVVGEYRIFKPYILRNNGKNHKVVMFCEFSYVDENK